MTISPVDRDCERGASAVEYALLIALIAAVVIGAVIALGRDVVGLFEVPIPE